MSFKNISKSLLDAVKSVKEGTNKGHIEKKPETVAEAYAKTQLSEGKMKLNSPKLNESVSKYANYISENADQLNELSKETLQSYKTKAENDPALAKKRGRVSSTTQMTRAKRIKGLENAAKKLGDIRKKEFEKSFAKSQAKNEDLHKHFHKEAPKILAKHGYTKVSENDKRATYVRPHETGHVTTVTLHKKTPELGVASHDFGSSINMSTRHHTHDGGSFIDDDKHTKQKREMMPKFEAAVIKHHSDDWHWGHVNESFNLEVFSDNELETLDALISEDYEQLDEISKKTLGSYIKKASGTFDHERNTPGRVATSAEDARRYITDPKNDPYYGSNGNEKIYNKIGKKLSNRRSGINKALDRLTKEEVEQIDELSKKTLGSYIKKASSDMAEKRANQLMHSAGMGDEKPTQKSNQKHIAATIKRQKGISKAVNKLTKEDLEAFSEEELEFIESIVSEDYDLTEEEMDYIVNNITEEEFEQLDELSKDTLKNYIKKATGQAHAAYGTVDHMSSLNTRMKKPHIRSAARKKGAEAERLANKRISGISKAYNRLTKEETEE